MKILHMIGSLKYGGAESLIASLLPSLKERGLELVLVSLTSSLDLRENIDVSGIKIFDLGFVGNIYSLKEICSTSRKFGEILRREEPDIIHTHLFMPDIIARISSPLNSRLVTTLHTSDPWWQEKGRLRSIVKTGLDSISGKFRKVRYIAVSEYVQNYARQYLRINEGNIRTIYNGIQIENYASKLEYSHKDIPRIIQVGNFYRHKGHEESLRALKHIKEEYGNAILNLAGDGPERKSLEEIAAKLGLAENIKFLGIRNDIPKLLKEADIFWMPSKWEGMPLACIEAMACGLPVVASNVGGLPEIVSEGLTGYLIDKDSSEELAEKTITLLDNIEIARRFGINGRKRVESRFTMERMATAYENSYQDIMKGIW
ncbi:MAG: glycosyltransferase [bacterium]